MLEDAVRISGDTEAAALNLSNALASGLSVLLSDWHCELDTVLADKDWFPGCTARGGCEDANSSRHAHLDF